jgi:hypothetical protein
MLPDATLVKKPTQANLMNMGSGNRGTLAIMKVEMDNQETIKQSPTKTFRYCRFLSGNQTRLENPPFIIDEFPMNSSIYKGFPATFDYRVAWGSDDFPGWKAVPLPLTLARRWRAPGLG